MQALKLLQLAKRHVSGRSDIDSEEIKRLAIAIIELCLSESISSYELGKHVADGL